ncbi:tat protein [Simian immunodeficiency virus]|uniref:Protein Tat n=1 Tax=Simian immunodeficiency virus TaxID=11723 RepID=Q6EZD5_SIV|nr:tat protein [Simian immunodeficiency virus]
MDVQGVGLEHPEEVILYDPFRKRETSCNTCYCKKCCYHCQLCFLQKGLGINYASRARRRRSKEENKADKFPVPNHRSISTTRGNRKLQEKKEKTVEKKVATSTTIG